MENGPTQAAIERLTDEAFCFAHQIEECESRLFEGQVNMEQYATGLQEKTIEILQNALH